MHSSPPLRHKVERLLDARASASAKERTRKRSSTERGESFFPLLANATAQTSFSSSRRVSFFALGSLLLQGIYMSGEFLFSLSESRQESEGKTEERGNEQRGAIDNFKRSAERNDDDDSLSLSTKKKYSQQLPAPAPSASSRWAKSRPPSPSTSPRSATRQAQGTIQT